jgi:hypothetical protein
VVDQDTLAQLAHALFAQLLLEFQLSADDGMESVFVVAFDVRKWANHF